MRGFSTVPPLAVRKASSVPAKKAPPIVEMRLPTSMRKSFFRFVRHTLQGAYAKIFNFESLSPGDLKRFKELVKKLGNESFDQRVVVSELRKAFAEIEADYLFHSQFVVLEDAEAERLFSSTLIKCIRQLEKLAGILDGEPHKLVREEIILDSLIGDVMFFTGISSYRYSAPSSLLLDADKLDMFLLFENLVSNSKRACERKGVIPSIEVVAFRSDEDIGMAEVMVRDNGIGFTPGELIHAEASRGFTSKDKGKGTIHGVGLIHCRFIVHAHGGWLSVSSAKNEGSDITLTLPLAEK